LNRGTGKCCPAMGI